jgi:hypothetical protein
VAKQFMERRPGLHFVWRERRKAAGIGCEERSRDREVATLNGEFQILQRRRPDCDGMHLHADSLAEHAAGIAHATRFIDHIGDGRALDDFVTVEAAVRPALGKKVEQMFVGNKRAFERHRRTRSHALRRAAIHRKKNTLHPKICKIFGRRHGLTDRFLHMLETGHGPRLDAARFPDGCAD